MTRLHLPIKGVSSYKEPCLLLLMKEFLVLSMLDTLWITSAACFHLEWSLTCIHKSFDHFWASSFDSNLIDNNLSILLPELFIKNSLLEILEDWIVVLYK